MLYWICVWPITKLLKWLFLFGTLLVIFKYWWVPFIIFLLFVVYDLFREIVYTYSPWARKTMKQHRYKQPLNSKEPPRFFTQPAPPKLETNTSKILVRRRRSS